MLIVTLALLDLGQILLGDARSHVAPKTQAGAAVETQAVAEACTDASPFDQWRTGLLERLMPWKRQPTLPGRCGFDRIDRADLIALR